MKQFSAEHSALYAALQEKIRVNPSVAGLFDLLFNRNGIPEKKESPTPTPGNLDEEYAI